MKENLKNLEKKIEELNGRDDMDKFMEVLEALNKSLDSLIEESTKGKPSMQKILEKLDEMYNESVSEEKCKKVCEELRKDTNKIIERSKELNSYVLITPEAISINANRYSMLNMAIGFIKEAIDGDFFNERVIKLLVELALTNNDDEEKIASIKTEVLTELYNMSVERHSNME